jgi:hypothetical protein
MQQTQNNPTKYMITLSKNSHFYNSKKTNTLLFCYEWVRNFNQTSLQRRYFTTPTK